MIYLKLFITFAQIGIFGFGGGMAMLPIIYQTAEKFQLMGADEFGNLVAVSQVTPGPIAVNAATYTGYNAAGIPGAFFATLGIGVPSFLLVTLCCRCMQKWGESRALSDAFDGIRPVTAGLILAAVFILGKSIIGPGGMTTENIIAAVIFVISYGLMASKKLSPVKIIILSGVAGGVLNSFVI